MCLDLFAPNRCLDIEFLFEQIWFEQPKNSDIATNPLITEVYDVLLFNPPGNEPLNCLRAIFPHDCTYYQDDKPTSVKFDIQAYGMEPPVPRAYQAYEWPYEREPSWVNGRTTFKRVYAQDYADRGTARREVEARPLVISKISLPFETKVPSPQLRAAFADLYTTYVDLVLRDELKANERGWLRLIVRPKRLDKSPAQVWNWRGTDEGICRQRYCVTSPLLLRSRLQGNIERRLQEYQDEKRTPYEEIRSVLEEGGFCSHGTSTRIADHRVALVTSGEAFDICDMTCSAMVKPYGEVPFETSRQYGMWWGTGSDRNSDRDLVHQVNRIIDRLRFNDPGTEETISEIARYLAPSGKFEAYCTLLKEMVAVQLLSQTEHQSEKVRLPDDLIDATSDARPKPLSPCFNPRLSKLRGKYADVQRMDLHGGSLHRDFMDLHAFRIDYRLISFGKTSISQQA
jgi:hypothetical protein